MLKCPVQTDSRSLLRVSAPLREPPPHASRLGGDTESLAGKRGVPGSPQRIRTVRRLDERGRSCRLTLSVACADLLDDL